jgi:3-deoxy-manno-octulosonate cytidylyltransferase (CMP-KDO synthetase)
MRTLAVIPARYRSSRFPGKILAEIAGRTMIQHVYDRTQSAMSVEEVIVATDDPRIVNAVLGFGGQCLMTSPLHESGTDRVAEVASDLDADLIVNVQGDEPLIDPQAIDQAVAACLEHQGEAIASLRRVIRSGRELWDPNAVKVVTDAEGMALYFSRWPIPFVATKDMSPQKLSRSFIETPAPETTVAFKHIGLYVYPKPILLELARTKPTKLEQLEKLEQLRALEHGIPIRVEVTEYDNIAVDTPEDLERVREMFEKKERKGAKTQRRKEE